MHKFKVFIGVYTTQQGFRDMDEILEFVQPRLPHDMNEGMDRPYTEEEIKTTLFQMDRPHEINTP